MIFNLKASPFYLTWLSLIALGAPPIWAASPVSNVGTAKVNKGDFSIEQRMGYTLDTPDESDHERLRMRQHLDYGFNDWYAVRLITQQDKPYADSLEFRSITIENRIQLFEKDRDGWDGGFRISYNHADGDKTPHGIAVRLLAQSTFGDGWAWRHNSVIDHDVGQDAENGLALELRSQLVKRVYEAQEEAFIESVSVGAEMFNDFGKTNEMNGFDSQDHQIGPVASIKLMGGSTIQVGYRYGLSQDAADHLFKLFVGHEF